MFGSKKNSLPGEIDLSSCDFLHSSREFARLWSEPDGNETFIIEPANLGADPALFGMAMVDCIRHAAIAYARAVNVSEQHALERIMMGFQAELENPTDDPQPLLGDEGTTN